MRHLPNFSRCCRSSRQPPLPSIRLSPSSAFCTFWQEVRTALKCLNLASGFEIGTGSASPNEHLRCSLEISKPFIRAAIFLRGSFAGSVEPMSPLRVCQYADPWHRLSLGVGGRLSVAFVIFMALWTSAFISGVCQLMISYFTACCYFTPHDAGKCPWVVLVPIPVPEIVHLECRADRR